nr:MAG TPA: hypothetical protein [Caudoviricetes sp.]
MRPYRIKHKTSGLYYRPFLNYSNLTKRGKVYISGNNALNYYKCSDSIDIEVRIDTTVYKQNKELFKDFKEVEPWKVFKRVPKSEFEIEIL